MEHFEFDWQTNDGLKLYAQGWRGDTPPRAIVCLVHGIGEHSGRYVHVAHSLTEAGYALLTMDLRGNGKSQGRRGHTTSYEALLDDVAHLLDEADDHFPKHFRFLYGHSMGGNLVLNYTLRRRPNIAGVIATSPWIHLAFKPPFWKIPLGRVMNVLWPSLSLDNELNAEGLSHDPGLIQTHKDDPLNHGYITPRLGISMLGAGQWALDHANEFPLPLLLMHGGADPFTSVQASRTFAERLSADHTFKIWEGMYHETHNELQKNEVINYLIDWLDKQTDKGEVVG